MPNVIDIIETTSGLAVMNYNTLSNLPSSDKGLTKDGGFADGKVTGQRINSIRQILEDENGSLPKDNLTTAIKNIKDTIVTLSDKDTDLSKLIQDNSNAIQQLNDYKKNQDTLNTKYTTSTNDLYKHIYGSLQKTENWNSDITNVGYYYSFCNSNVVGLPSDLKEDVDVMIYGQTTGFNTNLLQDTKDNQDNIQSIFYQVIYPINFSTGEYSKYERFLITTKDNIMHMDWVCTSPSSVTLTQEEVDALFTHGNSNVKDETSDSSNQSEKTDEVNTENSNITDASKSDEIEVPSTTSKTE